MIGEFFSLKVVEQILPNDLIGFKTQQGCSRAVDNDISFALCFRTIRKGTTGNYFDPQQFNVFIVNGVVFMVNGFIHIATGRVNAEVAEDERSGHVVGGRNLLHKGVLAEFLLQG